MTTKSTCLALIFTILLGSTLAWAQRSASSVVEFNNIEEVIQKWNPENQLYVRGNLGIGSRQLSDLSNWLREHGPHWTIVLMERAENQTFSSQDGRTYRGMDAVEAALGLGLNNRTSFGTLVHPDTKESDGAVFVLFLRERKFSYYASDAQDARNLGEAHWVGQLDQPAFRAMRNGGRILDAVKDTVTSINVRLGNAIAAEKNAKLRLEEQRQRELVQVQTNLADLKSRIGQVSAKSQAFLQEYPQATGEMAKPPVEAWSRKVSELSAQLTIDTSNPTEQQASKLSAEIDRYENAYAAQAGFKQHLESSTLRASNFVASASPVVKKHGQNLRTQLDTAQTQLKTGEIEFIDSLAQSDELLQTAQSAAEQFAQAQEQAQQRERLVRRTIIWMLWGIAAIVAAVLWFANHRRKATKQKAIDQWQQRDQSVRKETDQLDQLFQRNDDILGSKEQLEQRGYVGLTQSLAMKALDYVDDLFIMSKEVKRVLNEARQLIQPASLYGQVVNLFSSSRYQEAIDHITGSPLKFHRSTGIPLIIRDMGVGQIVGGQTGGIADEVQLTFEEIFSALQKRGIEAQQALNTIEDCLANVQDRLTETQKQLDNAAEQEKQLDTQSAADGLFDVPSYFSKLIPSIQNNLKQADDLSAFDAVQAVQGPLTIAQRQLTEAMELGRQLLLARQQLFPKLQSDAQSLKQQGYTANWIGQTLGSITSRADQLFQQAAAQSIADGNGVLTAELDELSKRSTQVVTLAQQIQSEHLPKQTELATAIEETRKDLAGALKLKVSQVLHELDLDPDDSLARAKSSLEAARAMLLEGRVNAVEEAIATFHSAFTAGNQILSASKDAVKNYKSRSEQLTQSLRDGQSRIPKLTSDIDSARRAYAASALVVAPQAELVNGPIITAQVVEANSTDKVTGSRNERSNGRDRTPASRSVDWYMQQAQQGHEEITRLLESASSHYSSGQVLAATQELNQVESLLTTTENRLTQVADHLQLLQAQTETNVAQQQRNEGQLESLQQAKRNPLVMQATLSAIDQLKNVVDSNRQLVIARTAAPNPFETSQALLKTQRQMEQVQSQIVGDQQAHAEARRAVQGARQQLQQANQLVRQSQSDGIPDSQQIIQTNSRISQLSTALNDVESQLDINHGDWRLVDQRAAQLQTELASSTQALSSELSLASQALVAFQQASQIVLQAGQWAGPWGVRVAGSPGVSELERARRSLQNGNYDFVFQISQVALLAAQTALQQAEREVARRRMEEEREREAERRAREAATRRHRSDSFDFGSSSGGSIFSGGGSSSSSSSSSGASDSGFSRSGW